MSLLGNAILDSLRNRPGNWEFNHFHAVDKASGLSLWIANGWSWLSIDTGSPVQGKIGFFESIRIWRQINRTRDMQAALFVRTSEAQ